MVSNGQNHVRPSIMRADIMLMAWQAAAFKPLGKLEVELTHVNVRM
jgi:hypothetical protein